LKRTIYILLTLLAVALTSCREGCYQPTRSLVGIGFLDSLSRKPVTFPSVTVRGLGSDSVLYKSSSVSAIYLPLHVSKDSTNYVITFTNGEKVYNDTLNIFHTLNTQFLSPACGCVPTYVIDSFKIQNYGDLFKNIEFYNPEVKNIEQDIHVKIYF